MDICYLNIPKASTPNKEKRLNFCGHSWRRNENESVSDVLLWNPQIGKRKPGRPANTYNTQLIGDTGCTIEESPTAMMDRKEWKELVIDCRVSSTW